MLFIKAYNSYNELQEVLKNFKGNFDELKTHLKSYYWETDFFDFNFQCLCGTIYRTDDNGYSLCNNAEVYQQDGMIYGTFTFKEIEKRAKLEQELIDSGIYDFMVINDKPCLFTNLRVNENELPTHLYVYNIRGDFSTIEKNVLVDHKGTIISNFKIKLNKDKNSYCDIHDYTFVDFDEYMENV